MLGVLSVPALEQVELRLLVYARSPITPAAEVRTLYAHHTSLQLSADRIWALIYTLAIACARLHCCSMLETPTPRTNLSVMSA